jgi:hypothetical protein
VVFPLRLSRGARLQFSCELAKVGIVADKSNEQAESDEAIRVVPSGRRDVLRTLVWAAPAIVATATLKARAQDGSCDPPPVTGDGDGDACPPP